MQHTRPESAGRLEPATTVVSAITDATDTRIMRVECSLTRGFSGLQMIGNTAEVCRDGKERARAALERLNIHLPPQRLVLSLTPADLRKDGSQFDLPIAVSLALLIMGTTPQVDPSRWMFVAELGLGGELRPVKGVVSFALAAIAEGLDGVVVAVENLAEVSALERLEPLRERPLAVLAFRSLGDVLVWLSEGQVVTPPVAQVSARVHSAPEPDAIAEAPPDFDDMILHPEVEQAALVAAVGMHSLLLRGSPGTGKSMLAARLPSILPDLMACEHIEAMRIHSMCMEKLSSSILRGRPTYRAPHHQASVAAVLGSADVPGEISLAHGGVLFLDELAEFRRDLLESLREPLETGMVHVARTRRKATWKARIVLVAACNNCPCGWFGSKRQMCTCGITRRQAYGNRLSGPILDRIDIQLNMPEPDMGSSDMFLHLATVPSRSKTQELAARVREARDRAEQRNAAFELIFNRDLNAQHLLAASGLSSDAFAGLIHKVFPASASSRAVIRTLRVARTLADLAASPVLRLVDLRTAWSWQAESAAKQRGETP